MLDAKKEKIVVYSSGVGCDISFVLKLLRRYKNIQVFAFDPKSCIDKLDFKEQSLPDNFYLCIRIIRLHVV